MTIERFDKGPRMSQAVVHGDRVYLAGQVADDTSEDVAGQTRQILAKIEALLAKAGSSKERILTANVWLYRLDKKFDRMTGRIDTLENAHNAHVNAPGLHATR